MGKGSGETTTQNFTPEMEKGIADAITLARKSVRPYMPYQGADLAAKTGGMIAGDQGLNASRTALGLTPMTSSLPEAQNFDGVMGYSSYPMYVSEMERARTNYPDLIQKIDDLQNDPFGLKTQPVNASIPSAASTGGVMNAATAGVGTSMREDDPFPNHGNTPDMFDGGMLFGNSNQNPTTLNTSYSPVGDFVDWISGGYDYPEQTQADKDYYNDPTSAFNSPGGWHPTD
tara:strand:- start:9253 stop:9942 length:690 start_codon:yes stop_codon:yes gene_type:complete